MRSHPGLCLDAAGCTVLKGFVSEGYVIKGSSSVRRFLLVLPLLILFVCSPFTVGQAQGLPQFPGQRNPSNDCGCSRGDEGIPVSSGMISPFFPKIPNLELGYLYYFGNHVRTGRFTADYMLPFYLSPNSVVFGEAHGEGWGFWKKPTVTITTPAGFTTTTSTANSRVDLSFGGGYRTMLGRNALVGVNGFYDTSRLYNRWYSSGGVGLAMAANVAGDDAIDLNVNWYGNLFNRDVLVNAFRSKGNSFDIEAGYSHALFDHSLDLRLKLIGYQFDIGAPVRGWRGGADLTTRNGMFTLRYEYGHDPLNGYYNTIGGLVTVGFNLENVLSGKSPLTLPEPVFRSPRNLRRLLGLKVKRNWYQPEAVILARSIYDPPPPTPPVMCPNLQGSILLLTTYTNATRLPFSSFTPPIAISGAPQSRNVRVCWCGLQISLSPADHRVFEIQTNVCIYGTGAQSLFTNTDGCADVTVSLVPGVPPDPQTIIIYLQTGPKTMTFNPGGGISIEIQ